MDWSVSFGKTGFVSGRLTFLPFPDCHSVAPGHSPYGARHFVGDAERGSEASDDKGLSTHGVSHVWVHQYQEPGHRTQHRLFYAGISQFFWKPFFTFNSMAIDTLSMPREPIRPSRSSRREGTVFGGTRCVIREAGSGRAAGAEYRCELDPGLNMKLSPA